MPKFLDVNVWLPLVWDGHVASRTAQAWVTAVEDDLLICRVTQLALLRHLTNPAILGKNALTNAGAAKLVRTLTSQKAVFLAPDPPGIEAVFPLVGESKKVDRNRWTDAYLAAFAIAGDHELVTYDQDFRNYAKFGLKWRLLKV